MSTTLPDVTIAGQPADAFVRQLSDEQKDAVIAALFREAIRVTGGRSVVPFTADGSFLGYYVPPDASSSLKIVPPVLTPEQMERTRQALETLDDTFDVEKFLSEGPPEDPQG